MLFRSVALGVVAVAGYVVTGIMVAYKNQAQSQANSTASDIVAHGGGGGTCVAPTPKFAAACSAYASDNNQVNQDATAGNVAVGVGVAATVGFVVYWLVADKAGAGTSAMRTPVLTPMVGPSRGGLSFSTSF